MAKLDPKAFAAALAAMTTLAAPIYVGWEGEKNDPYQDILGVWTVCSGETRVPMRHYTDAECAQMTRNVLNGFGTDVSKQSPGIEASRLEWAAHTIFAANVGMGNYAKSSVRKFYNAGDLRNACRAMLLYDKGGGRVVVGLKNRRAGTTDRLGEYELCIGGAVPRVLGTAAQ